MTHSPPADPADAIEIPPATKQRRRLDAERSWVVLSEANDFIWPGPDLRPAVSGDLSSAAYGMLPHGFMAVLRERLLQRWAREANGDDDEDGVIAGRSACPGFHRPLNPGYAC